MRPVKQGRRGAAGPGRSANTRARRRSGTLRLPQYLVVDTGLGMQGSLGTRTLRVRSPPRGALRRPFRRFAAGPVVTRHALPRIGAPKGSCTLSPISQRSAAGRRSPENPQADTDRFPEGPFRLASASPTTRPSTCAIPDRGRCRSSPVRPYLAAAAVRRRDQKRNGWHEPDGHCRSARPWPGGDRAACSRSACSQASVARSIDASQSSATPVSGIAICRAAPRPPAGFGIRSLSAASAPGLDDPRLLAA